MDNIIDWNFKIWYNGEMGANIWLRCLEKMDYIRIARIMHIDNSQEKVHREKKEASNPLLKYNNKIRTS